MANTWNAASASYNDVADWLMPAGAYYSLVANGDTVVIPADTKTWSSQMTCDKAITIKGGAYSVDGYGVPSSCSTVINNGYGSMFVWTGVAN